MAAKPDILTRVLAMLVEVLAEAKPVRIEVDRGGLVAELTIRPAAVAKPSDEQASQPAPRELTATQDEIIEVLKATDKPIKASTIALRAKRKLTNHFRRLIYAFVQKGTLISCPDHRYWLAERPLPAQEE